VVARSGASSLAEISYYGLPSILIPFPEAAEDHQTRNAEVFVRKGAALLVVQDRHNGGPLAAALQPLLENAVARNGMARQAAGVMPAEATDRIIKELEDVIA
jgi:UDP-N-acetylglucosamine--N-acetylmuramyl-(pentapeptide) pyrophosphoryl-undecaprenol N-acetylglucosamine transferase